MPPDLPTPHRSNCLVWAVAVRRRHGGSLLWEWSKNGPWPHFYWVSPDRERVLSYRPLDKGILWDLFWFRGEIRDDH